MFDIKVADAETAAGESQPDTDLKAAIREILDTIGDPCSVSVGVPMGLHEMGLVEDIDIDDKGAVVLRMRLTSPLCHMIGYFNVEIEDRLLALEGVRTVEITTDRGLDWTADHMTEAARERRRLSLLAKGFPVRS